jgi:hypothetical protein
MTNKTSNLEIFLSQFYAKFYNRKMTHGIDYRLGKVLVLAFIYEI